MMVGNLKIDDVALLGGLDIYSEELGLKFHQPTIRDISIFGNSSWNKAINLFLWTKDHLDENGKKALEKYNNFECIYFFLQQTDKETKESLYDSCMNGFFLLVFPNYDVLTHQKEKIQIVLIEKETQKIITITDKNYDIFLEYIKVLFLNAENSSIEDSDNYKIRDGDSAAQRIKAKLDARHKILAKRDEKKNKAKHSVLYNMLSSLSLDSPSDLNRLYDFTLYQFYTQSKRYHKKKTYEESISAMLAGAQDIDLEDWYGDI